MATSRSGWRHAIHKGTEAYENDRQSSQPVKRVAMKARTITIERSTECPVCSRLCASDFGLRSHMRVLKQSAWLDFINQDSRPCLLKMAPLAMGLRSFRFIRVCYAAAPWSNWLAWHHQPLATDWNLGTPDTVAPATQRLCGFYGTESRPRKWTRGVGEEKGRWQKGETS